MQSNADYAINHIGAYFDNGTIDTSTYGYCGLPHTADIPQVLDSVIINDTLNWTRIQGSFVANGTEKYITIGNFSDSAHTAKIQLYGITGDAGSYYLIDDVSVIASDAVADAGPDVTIAVGDSTWIGIDSNGEGMPCYWYKPGSAVAIDSGGRILVKPDSTTTYVVSMDLCGNVTYDTVRVWVYPLSITNVQLQNVQIYPNPVDNQLTIANAKNSGLVIFNVLGSVVYRAVINSDKESINTGGLPEGVYTVKFTDLQSGQKMVKKVIKK